MLDESFAIGNVNVVEGRNGLFVAMPSCKAGDGYRDICFPITKEYREKINKAVLEAYRQAKGRAVQEGKERAALQTQADGRGPVGYKGKPESSR